MAPHFLGLIAFIGGLLLLSIAMFPASERWDGRQKYGTEERGWLRNVLARARRLIEPRSD